MSKATEDALSDLHATVAKVLAEQLESTTTLENENGVEVTISTVSPAMVAQAIKFLKDNSITADPKEDTNIHRVKDALKKKQKQGRKLRLVNPQQAAEE